MKVVRIMGGLGNQMFQYAFYLALRTNYSDSEIKIDLNKFTYNNIHNGFELNAVFNLGVKSINKKLTRRLSLEEHLLVHRLFSKLGYKKKSHFIEKEEFKFRYNPEVFAFGQNNVFFDGYWQTPKYFETIEPQIKSIYSFPKFKKNENIQLAEKIKMNNSVSIHIRRGDYVSHPLFGGICEIDYYENAINYIGQNVKNPEFFVFSDDPKWCRSNLKIEHVNYINWNSGDSAYRDMQLMSLCKHNIIANSSFSWWGAYLNCNPNKIVITPSKWKNDMADTRDLIPEKWMKI